MAREALVSRMADLFGYDVRISFDDDNTPSQLRLYRADPISEDLLSATFGKIADEFPVDMTAINDVMLSFDNALGTTRRRIALR